MTSRDRFWVDFDRAAAGLDEDVKRAVRDEINAHIDAEIAARLEMGETPESATANALASLGKGQALARKLYDVHVPKSGNEYHAVWFNAALLSVLIFNSISSAYYEYNHATYLILLVSAGVLSMGYALVWAFRHCRIPFWGILATSITALMIGSLGGAIMRSDVLRFPLTGTTTQSFLQQHRESMVVNEQVLSSLRRVETVLEAPKRVFGHSISANTGNPFRVQPTSNHSYPLRETQNELKMELSQSEHLIEFYGDASNRSFWSHFVGDLGQALSNMGLPLAGFWFCFYGLGFLLRSIFDRWNRRRLESNRSRLAL